jgi:hypothetical protein
MLTSPVLFVVFIHWNNPSERDELEGVGKAVYGCVRQQTPAIVSEISLQ